MKGVISCTFDGCLHVSTWDGKLSTNAGVDAYLGKIKRLWIVTIFLVLFRFCEARTEAFN